MSNIVACLRHYGLVGTVRRLFHMKGDVKVGRLVGVDQVRSLTFAVFCLPRKPPPAEGVVLELS